MHVLDGRRWKGRLLALFSLRVWFVTVRAFSLHSVGLDCDLHVNWGSKNSSNCFPCLIRRKLRVILSSLKKRVILSSRAAVNSLATLSYFRVCSQETFASLFTFATTIGAQQALHLETWYELSGHN
jgi:hypothetical protein